MEDTLINFGSELKLIGETDDAWEVGGWAVVFGTHDASRLRDKFLKSTDYDVENGETRSLYYNHGLDGTIKKTRLGRATLEVKDAGVWYSGEIKKRTDYLKEHAAKIVEGVKAGIYGTSTGAPAHLVERKAVDGGHEVTLWPISEISITPTPAEPLTSCISLKSLIEIEEGTDELKAVTNTTTAPPYPAQQSGVVDYPTRQPVLTDEDSDYSRCAACSAHNAPDATKCAECGALMPESGRKSVSDELAAKLLGYLAEDEFKKYDPDQPRNDKGEWDSGSSGGGSAAPSSGDNHVTQSAVSKMSVKDAKAKLKELKTAKKAHSEKMKTADRSDANYRSADGGWSKDVAASMALNEAISRLENHILVDPQTSQLRDARKSIAEQLELEDDEAFDFAALKKYDPRQPRDDLGKWSSGGSGGISIGHALHVAKHEGIADEHHAGIEDGIRSGKLATREAVLAHIDAIHAARPLSKDEAWNRADQYGTGGMLESGFAVAQRRGLVRTEGDLRQFGNIVKQNLPEGHADLPLEKRQAESRRAVEAAMAHMDAIHAQQGTSGPKAGSTPAAAPASSGATPKAAQGLNPKLINPQAAASLAAVRKDLEGTGNRARGYETSHQQSLIADIALSLQRGGGGLPYHLADKAARDLAHGDKIDPVVEKVLTNKPLRVSHAGSIGLRPSLMQELGYEYGGKEDRYGTGTMWVPKGSDKKSFDEYDDDTPETKHLTELTELLPDGIGFEAHSTKVLAAVEEFVERSESLKTIRCERDGRRWSAEKYQSLTEFASGLSQAADAIKAMAEAHAPRSTATPQDALKALAQIEITRARLNGIAL